MSLAPEPLCICDRHHPAFIITLPMSTRASLSAVSECKWNFKRADYVAINNYLNSIVWDDVLDCLGIDDAVDFLYEHLNYVISAYVPTYLVRKSSYPVRFSKKLITLMKAKRVAHYQFKISNCFFDYLIFSNLRAQCKFLSSNCFSEYVKKSEDAIADNVKIFWSFVNAMTNSSTLPTYICLL